MFIPNAVEKVALIAATLKDVDKWILTTQLRHIGSAALVEDNSVRSNSSTLINFKARRNFENNQSVHIDLLNAFNRKFYDISYYAANQLRTTQNGTLITAPLQVHPGEPRSVRLTYAVKY